MIRREDLYRAVFPDDVHLASSKNIDGAFRGAVLDNATNHLRGQAEFLKVDIGDEDTAPDGRPSALLAGASGLVAGILVAVVAVKAAPRVKRRWLENAWTRVDTTTGKCTESKGDKSDAVVLALDVPAEVDPPEFPMDETGSE